MAARCRAASRRFPPVGMKITRLATLPSKPCARSGTALPISNSAPACWAMRHPSHARIAACAGACNAVAPRVAAVIPVLNEEGAIGPTIAALPRDAIGTVIVVDGVSRDGTVAEARAAGADVLVEY